jgi:hypothetical protein
MLFDTSDPYNFKHKATIPGWNIHWTISDMDVDSKEQLLLYTSLDQHIRLVNLSLEGR